MIIVNRSREKISERNHPLLPQIAETILREFYPESLIPNFSLIFVSKTEIQRLNNEFREVNSVTDVLSFPSDGEIDPETGAEYLGDILICVDQARHQASVSGHEPIDEFMLLLIHGLLHLLGYDHMTAEEHDEMWELQDEYLNRFSIQLGRRPGQDEGF